jgi:leader peptidase (prepilin peptidase)/N-methyltransferase
MMIWLYALIGAVVGSFLNVMADRMPERQSLVRPPSACPGCRRRLVWFEMVPVLSYLALRGRCRTCGARIPLRVLGVELATAALYALLWQRFQGQPLLLGLMTFFACILVVIFVIDLEHKLVLNRVVLPAILLALVAAPLRAYATQPPFADYALMGPLMVFWGARGIAVGLVSLVSQVVGGLVAFGIFFLIYVLTPGGMGAGDVKLAALAGLLTALPGALLAVFGSFVLGGLTATLLLLARLATRKSTIPFGPFLVITTLAVMLYGDPLLRAYLGI